MSWVVGRHREALSTYHLRLVLLVLLRLTLLRMRKSLSRLLVLMKMLSRLLSIELLCRVELSLGSDLLRLLEESIKSRISLLC